MFIVILWEKIHAIMIDSLTKNLKVGYGVAKDIDSDHIPLHILCTSLTCEKLDDSYINVPVSIEF